MKLDKETVVKHQFWFLLGTYLLVWFIAMLWLKVAAGEPIAKAKKAYEDQASQLTNASKNPVNVDKFLPPWNAASQAFNHHKGVIWGQAWEFQKEMYDWPKAWESKDMTTPQTELTTDERSEYKDKWYPQEIDLLRKNAPKVLAPIELAGEFDGIFQPQKWQNTPTREEIWLTQEDYWVKRELLLILWRTLADLAYMPPIPIDEKEAKPEGVEVRYRCANQSWEITLNLRKDKKGQLVIGGDSTIKNIDPSRRPQPLTNAKGEGIWFNVAQEQERSRFEIRGEPVGWNETRYFSMSKDSERKDYEPSTGIAWDKIDERPIAVSEAFDQTNSPIRRLNTLAVPKQDCRTFAWILQANKELEKLDVLPEDADAAKKATTPPPTGSAAPPGGPAAGGGPGGMMGGRGGMEKMAAMMGIGGLGGGGAISGNTTPNNNIPRDRYLMPEKLDEKSPPPSRHLPVALQLIVEQSHMHDVMLAFVNSRLRMQITQVEYEHNKDFVPQPDEDPKDNKNAMASGRNVFMGGLPMMFGGMPGKGMGAAPMAPGATRGRQARTAPGMQQGGIDLGGMSPSMAMRMGSRMGMRGLPPSMLSQFMGGNATRSAFPGAMRGRLPQGPGESASSEAAQDQHDDNLVDLTIYGIATLYRSPDAPKTSEQLGQPNQTGQAAPPPPPGGKR